MNKSFICGFVIFGLIGGLLGACTTATKTPLVTIKTLALTQTSAPTLFEKPTQTPPGPPTLEPTGTATATQTKIAPTSTALPSQTPQPTATAVTTPQRLTFSTGATALNLNDKLAKNSSKTYVLSAMEKQLMMVLLSMGNDGVSLSISGADGKLLGSTTPPAMYWQGSLPSTQDYLITVKSGSAEVNYNLGIIIPVRIQFKPGAISARLESKIAARDIVTCLAWAAKGQTMAVRITSTKKDVFLTIYGLADGQPLVRSASEATEWSGKLPANQDYVIEAVATGDVAEDFTLEVTIK